MTSWATRFGLTATVCLGLACIDTGQERVVIPLQVAGTALDEPIEGRDGFLIELTQAELAFGPFYVCAGALAGDNCQTARLEWLGSVVVDALDPSLLDAGWLSGVSGPVRSAMYDLGITSLLSMPAPVELAAAEALEGNSVRLSGRASRDAESLVFDFGLPIRQGADSEIGVSVVRISAAPDLVHEVTGAERSLLVRFDPRPWVRDIDFAAATGRTPADGDPSISVGPDSQAQRAVRAALLAGQRPSFEWIGDP